MYRQSEKNLLNSNISSTCPHNVANFGPLAVEIGSGIWGTPTNFNGFCVLASLLQRRRSLEVNQTLHGGRHLYLAGRPSLCASAHIRVLYLFITVKINGPTIATTLRNGYNCCCPLGKFFYLTSGQRKGI